MLRSIIRQLVSGNFPFCHRMVIRKSFLQNKCGLGNVFPFLLPIFLHLRKDGKDSTGRNTIAVSFPGLDRRVLHSELSLHRNCSVINLQKEYSLLKSANTFFVLSIGKLF